MLGKPAFSEVAKDLQEIKLLEEYRNILEDTGLILMSSSLASDTVMSQHASPAVLKKMLESYAELNKFLALKEEEEEKERGSL